MSGVSGRIGELMTRLCRRHESRVRDSFAAALERAVEDVDRPLHRGGAAVAIDRPGVAEAAPLLLRVAERLRTAAPLSRKAMRLVRSLVGDGAGPLYARSGHRSEYPPGTLSQVARTILAVSDDRHVPPTRQPVELARH